LRSALLDIERRARTPPILEDERDAPTTDLNVDGGDGTRGVRRTPSILEHWRDAPTTDPNVDGRRGERDVRRTPSILNGLRASYSGVSEALPRSDEGA
jgi:hypothetical protein